MSKEVSGGVFDRADARRIKSQTFIGQDLVPRPRRLALMNLFLHGVEPHIYLGDAIFEPERGERYDVVLTNPPFGTKSANQAPDRDDFTIETSKCLRTATTAQLRSARQDRAQARRPRRAGAAGQAGGACTHHSRARPAKSSSCSCRIARCTPFCACRAARSRPTARA